MTGASSECPFCLRASAGAGLLASNGLAAAFADGFPVSPGHSLVVPRRHVSDYFELTREEQAAVWALVGEVKVGLDRERSPAGYNIGINVGPAGGQTVWHAHVHVIPRFTGDVEDPRGGVRRVLRAKAPYWKESK